MRVFGLVLFSLSMNLWAMDTPKPVEVTYAELAAPQQQSVTGQVLAEKLIPLSFRVGGWVEQRSVELGQSVKQGERLASLDSVDLQLSLNMARADLAQARANADYASKEWTRLSNLSKQKMVSEQVLQQALAQAKSTKQAVIKAQAAMKLAERQLGYAQLSAPQSGTVVSVNVEAGQQVEAGKTMFELASGDLEASVTLTSALFAQAPVNAKAVGIDQAFQCQAILNRKNALNDATSLQYQAYYRLEQCSQTPPMGAVVRLNFDTQDEGFQRIPLSAVIHQGQPSVWLVRDGQLQAQAIDMVRMDAKYAYIRPTLALDQAIVAQGAHVLVEGQSVKVTP